MTQAYSLTVHGLLKPGGLHSSSVKISLGGEVSW